MKIIENGLVPVMENEKGEQLVNARELHSFLEIKTKFSDWIKDRVQKYNFDENIDYITFSEKTEKPYGGRPSTEYILKLDIAKEIAMVENNEQGKKIRRYFIDVEKKVKQRQLESIDHFKKEQMMLDFVMNKLNINEGSKIKMLKQFNKAHNLTTEYLPDYTDEKITKSLSELLKQYEVGMSTIKMNSLLIKYGLLEEKTRPSTSKGTKKYKSLTDKGLKYGKNLISSSGNQKETQPHYYEDTFNELVELVFSNERRRCS
ncbi:antA/AntB antirepressor family protein [Clostridium sp. YIM B02551]|uniref:antA/AntB antirepressor family protein n=1 Tax=Clostridium sp. YIM B02551 TaxID=2910679 RepID=UPI001EEA4EAE|nr:antA/AntB antirepressor family protein [Clostridium sp. YIM B02551]